MEEVEDRVVATRCFVAGGSVDGESAVDVENVAVIPCFADRAVGDIVDAVETVATVGDEKNVGKRGNIACSVDVGGVGGADAVDIESVAI